ncbi:MAG: 2-C-methyl-D-erythritol 4-phosphate cytidylyltransferase [Bacteroidales bacterium]|nr:2-C-methyl-D-erythritol 4-phosphate cytidylyltransferase [Bacteroidales bacterium]
MVSDIHIIVVAAGSGTRFGSPLPKQFCQLEGRPVVMRAIDSLRRALPDAAMTIVLAESDIDRFSYLCNLHQFASPQVVAGGATRWESVKRGLATVADGTRLVMVHDGARPFPTETMIESLVATMADDAVHGAVPVVPVTDSLRLLSDDRLGSVPFDRSRLRAVQTPQIFRADELRRAYELPYQETFTDDASVIEAAGMGEVVLTQGDPLNLKITHPLDITIAETILNSAVL